MYAKYINLEDHALRFYVVGNLVDMHNTPQGSKARDRVAILKTMDRPAHDIDERHLVPWERTRPNGNEQRTLVCLAKSVLGTDYGASLEQMTKEYATEMEITIDRAGTQERKEPHKDDAPASYDVFTWAFKRNLCLDLVMKEGYAKLSRLHPSVYTLQEIATHAMAKGGPHPPQKRKTSLCITYGCNQKTTHKYK